MQGYLKKKCQNPIKKWQTRYFDLNRNILCYYEKSPADDAKQEPKEELNLFQLSSIGVDLDNQLVIVLNFMGDGSGPDNRTLSIKCPNIVFYTAWLSYFVVFDSRELKGRIIPTAFAQPIWTFISYLGKPEIANTEGIFRIQGDKALTDSMMRKLLFRNPAMDSFDISTYPTVVTASVLKRLLDKLPHTLLTEESYEEFVGLFSGGPVDDRNQKLKDILQSLPGQNVAYLHHLSQCLHIISNAPDNKMDARSLGILFGPMFVSREKDLIKGIGDFVPLQKLWAELITNCEEIFPETWTEFVMVVPKLQDALSLNPAVNLEYQGRRRAGNLWQDGVTKDSGTLRKKSFDKFVPRFHHKRSRNKLRSQMVFNQSSIAKLNEQKERSGSATRNRRSLSTSVNTRYLRPMGEGSFDISTCRRNVAHSYTVRTSTNNLTPKSRSRLSLRLKVPKTLRDWSPYRTDTRERRVNHKYDSALGSLLAQQEELSSPEIKFSEDDYLRPSAAHSPDLLLVESPYNEFDPHDLGSVISPVLEQASLVEALDTEDNSKSEGDERGFDEVEFLRHGDQYDDDEPKTLEEIERIEAQAAPL